MKDAGRSHRVRPIAQLAAALSLAASLLLSTCASGPSASTDGRLASTAVAAPPNPTAPSPAAAGGPATTGAPSLESEEELFRDPALDAFARRSLTGFSHYTLSNGIPFVFKENRSNQVFSLRIVVRGQSLFTPPAKAGIEAITLSMLAKGSRDYPYDEVQRLLYEKSARLRSSYESPDATSFGLTALSKYLPELFDLFADSFLHPRWDPAQFALVSNDFKVAKTRKENDPSAMSVLALEKRLFAGHPYSALPTGVDGSLANITLEDVVDYYPKLTDAGRLLVVGVGDFDPQRLRAMLDATLGMLPPSAEQVGAPPPLVVHPGLATVPFTESAGLAYLLGAFSLPHPASPDNPAILIALAMLDDILYDTVRTQHGAAYGASVGRAGLAANYGMISIFKTSEPARVKTFIDESVRVLASGRCLAARVDASAAGKSGIGGPGDAGRAPAAYVPIAEALPFYRDRYITGFYAGQETNRSIAGQIAASAIYRGDYRDYLLATERLRSVTAASVSDAVDRYLVGAPTMWVAVGPPELLSTIDRREYGAAPQSD